jgi:hypothetical protein
MLEAVKVKNELERDEAYLLRYRELEEDEEDSKAVKRRRNGRCGPRRTANVRQARCRKWMGLWLGLGLARTRTMMRWRSQHEPRPVSGALREGY